MSITKLHIFAKNTDAPSTERGFQYQKLKTLETWVWNKVKNIDEKIYYDYEEDIFQRDVNNETAKFRQLKLYSSDFTFASIEIKKALFHFFMLFCKDDYFDNDVEFVFETNSSIKKQGKGDNAELLQKWFDNQENISLSIVDEIVNKVKAIIQLFIQNEISSEKDITTKNVLIEREKIFQEIPLETWRNFIKAIRWEFLDISPENAYIECLENVKNGLLNLQYDLSKEYIDSTILPRLIYKIVERSTENIGIKRILTNKLLEKTVLEGSDDEWYVIAKERWQKRVTITYFSIGEFHELISLSYHCRWTSYLQGDYDYWLVILKQYLSLSDTPPFARQKAIYEILWQSSKIGEDGHTPQGTLKGQEALIRQYFSNFEQFNSPEMTGDLCNLLKIIFSAVYKYGTVDIEEDELQEWAEKVIDFMENQIKTATNDNDRCSYLEQLAFLEKSYFDLDNSYYHFEQLIQLLPNAPLYPVQCLSNTIDKIIEMLIQLNEDNSKATIDRLEDISTKIEGFVSERKSNYDRGKKYIERGAKYLDNEQYIETLNCFHKAKDFWKQEETWHGYVLALLNICVVYSAMGMNLAAKYYALCALEISGTDENLLKYVSKSYALILRADFKQGAWISAIDDFERYLYYSQELNPNFDINSIEYLETFCQIIDIYFCAKELVPELEYLLEAKKKSWVLEYAQEAIDLDIVEGINEAFNSRASLINYLKLKCTSFPLNDLGKERRICWKALGITWTVIFENTWETNAIAEEFVALMQIYQVEIANEDLHIIPTEVEIMVEILSELQPIEPQKQPNCEKSVWKIGLPILENPDVTPIEKYFSLLRYAALFISEISLLKHEDYTSLFEDHFKGNPLINKIIPVSSYQNIYQNFYSKAFFDTTQRDKFSSVIIPEFEVFCTDILIWKSHISPLYNQSIAIKNIEKRNKNSKYKIYLTLKRLVKDERFVTLVSNLKKEGWLEWQIILAIMNHTVSLKANQMLLHHSFKSEEEQQEFFCQKFDEILHKNEEETYIEIPIEKFLGDDFLFQLSLVPFHVLNSFGLKSKMDFPNVNAIRNILNERFNFDKDNI